MYQLDFAKAEESEIKLPTCAGSQRKQENSRKTSISASLTMIKPLCGSQQTVENSSRDGNTRPPDLSSEKPVAGQEATVRTRHRTTDWFKIGKGVRQGCILSPCLFNLFTSLTTRHTRAPCTSPASGVAWRVWVLRVVPRPQGDRCFTNIYCISRTAS